MSDHYDDYAPFTEGPLFPEDAGGLVDELATYLRAKDRDVSDAVARENRRDMAEDSFRHWLRRATDRILASQDQDPSTHQD